MYSTELSGCVFFSLPLTLLQSKRVLCINNTGAVVLASFSSSCVDLVPRVSIWVLRPQVEAFLTELYHGKPKSSDLARFIEKMKTISREETGGEGGECRVTLENIQSAMAQLKKEVWYFVYCWL